VGAATTQAERKMFPPKTPPLGKEKRRPLSKRRETLVGTPTIAVKGPPTRSLGQFFEEKLFPQKFVKVLKNTPLPALKMLPPHVVPAPLGIL